MRLRATAGYYAGQIRDYSHQAGLAALKVGTAERIECTNDPPAASAPIMAKAITTAKLRGRVSRRRDS